jgi:signal peptidase I
MTTPNTQPSLIESAMPWITAVVMAVFVGFGVAWYTGRVMGNFSALLMAVCGVTGIYWLAERFYFLPRRQAAAVRFETDLGAKQASLAGQGITKTDTVDVAAAQEQLRAQPWWLDWTAGLFPLITVVFLLRSFVYEPFKIPSGSMFPTLFIGDLILVDKFSYGLKVPVFHQRITQGAAVQRSDVIVFRYPPQPNIDYIKRVVGLPGDQVSYLNKELRINGQVVGKSALPEFQHPETLLYVPQFDESMPQALGGAKYPILNYPVNTPITPQYIDQPYRDACVYSAEGVSCKVPTGHYFVMGDNRDDSLDSRFWGFVPEGHVVGRARWVWMNFSHLSRIFTTVK